jgi:hypothetical protein
MQYIKVKFEDDVEALQEVFKGHLVRYCDLEGNTISEDGHTACFIVDSNPPAPSWAVADPIEAVLAPSEMLISKLEYLSAFEESELATIYTIAKTNVQIEIWLEKFRLAEFIQISDPRSQAGIRSLEASGLIQPGRANEILRKLGAVC